MFYLDYDLSGRRWRLDKFLISRWWKTVDFIYCCSKAVAFNLLSVCKPQRFHLCRWSRR